MTITVYTKPNCPQCTFTKKALDKRGLDYNEVDITNDTEALENVKTLGFNAAPVVVTDKDAWSGFRDSKIKDIVQ